MPSADLTTLLGRLLSAPRAGAEDLEFSLDRQGLERQALTLLRKRFHEVEKLLPSTCRRLKPRAFELFARYAVGFWPQGHVRHLRDAAEFCVYLKSSSAAAPSDAEWAAVRFALQKRRFWARWAGDLGLGAKTRRGLQILWRDRRGNVRQLAFYLSLNG